MENLKVSRFGPRALLIDFAEEVDDRSLPVAGVWLALWRRALLKGCAK
jgi:hypothetical protein